MSIRNTKYTLEFKKTIVNLYQSGKSYSQIQKEYGVTSSALSNWIKQFSEVKIDDDTILTAQQIKALQKRNAQLEEENLILKKQLRYSRHTRTKNNSSFRIIIRAFNINALPVLKGKQKYILQVYKSQRNQKRT